jgi:outer membrane immunogenic protein
MRLTSRILVFVSVFIAVSLKAQDWNGAYGGVHAGYSSVKPEFTEPVFEPDTVNPGVDGFAGGALLGYRGGILGIEGEVGIADFGTTVFAEGGDGFTQFESEWVSRIRLTMHHSSGNTLFFVAAGASAMSLYVDDAFIDDSSPDLVHDPSLSTLTGWTIGAGVERAMRLRVSARLEAIYDRYGGKDLSPNPGEGRIEPTAMTFRAAVVFRF